ncbi:hypothetical protein NQ314_006668 [Rhamnusium bicolor]|uniref:Uncharacterized protein n=1 Tax=Rhamnusium bicolor TaxID=1586634 RepID=A0AAV8Z005_9CUCU|nr:hypothetical protein NQ314_006668 [Rhamnusium bicolor]
MVGAVRRRFKDATDVQIKRAISTYLAGSADRNGGRKFREAKRNRDVLRNETYEREDDNN